MGTSISASRVADQSKYMGNECYACREKFNKPTESVEVVIKTCEVFITTIHKKIVLLHRGCIEFGSNKLKLSDEYPYIVRINAQDSRKDLERFAVFNLINRSYIKGLDRSYKSSIGDSRCSAALTNYKDTIRGFFKEFSSSESLESQSSSSSSGVPSLVSEPKSKKRKAPSSDSTSSKRPKKELPIVRNSQGKRIIEATSVRVSNTSTQPSLPQPQRVPHTCINGSLPPHSVQFFQQRIFQQQVFAAIQKSAVEVVLRRDKTGALYEDPNGKHIVYITLNIPGVGKLTIESNAT